MKIFIVSVLIYAGSLPDTALAQTINIQELYVDLKVAEKEEAAAKEVRLKWIDEERTRIRKELQGYSTELTEIKMMVPDPLKQRDTPPAVAKSQERERIAFNDWASSNDPLRHSAIMKGSGLNALLRVLGPISHYRRKRSRLEVTEDIFPSLLAANAILTAEASHFRMVPATSSGSKVVVRLNQLPLDLQWPPVVIQNWPVECKTIQKLRDEYVAILSKAAANDTQLIANRAELLDSAIELLQAMVIQKRRKEPERTSLSSHKRTQVHRELQDALRYLETVRATAERFKSAPGDYFYCPIQSLS